MQAVYTFAVLADLNMANYINFCLYTTQQYVVILENFTVIVIFWIF